MIPPSDVWISFVFLEGSTVPDAYLFDRIKKYWKPIPIRDVMQAIPPQYCNGQEVFEGDIIEIGGRKCVVDSIDRYTMDLPR